MKQQMIYGLNLDLLDTRLVKKIMKKAVDLGFNENYWTNANQIAIFLNAAISILQDQSNSMSNPEPLEDWINFWYNRLPIRNRRNVKTSKITP